MVGCGESPALSIEEGRIRAPVPGKDIAVGYLALTNHSQTPLRITQVSAPGIRSIEMHTTLHSGAQVSMQHLPVLILAPGEQAQFASGGMHLMLFGAAHLNGPTVPPTLNVRFDTASGISAQANFSIEGW